MIRPQKTDQHSLSRLPPEPFLYQFPRTQFFFNIADYGRDISPLDGLGVLAEAQIEIRYEMEQLPSHSDVPVAKNWLWRDGRAVLTMKPDSTMTHSIFGQMLAGLMVWGSHYGFVEVEVVFLMRRGGGCRVVGTGSFDLDR